MTAAHVISEEQERIETWRREELERGGYPSDIAADLAGRDHVDLRFAISLLERGCPPEVALQILK
jgi:hypothetical protein